MKDFHTTVRRIDEEITQRRQQIAFQQVEIARLEDARRVFMGIAEADAAAQAHRGDEHPTLLPGAHSRPSITVRPTGSGEKRIDKRPHSSQRGGKAKPRKPSGHNGAQDRVFAVLRQSPSGLKSSEVMVALDEPKGSQTIYQTLHYMKKLGRIVVSEAGRYTAVEGAPVTNVEPAADGVPVDDLKDRLLAALRSFGEPRPSGDVIKLAMGQTRPTKGTRDRCYWALRVLKDQGLIAQQGGLYSLKEVANP